jgi:hypothetical protein
VLELADDNEDDLDKKAHADREGTDTSRDHIDLGLKSSSDGGKNDESGDAALSASTITGFIFGSEGVLCVLICASCACCSRRGAPSGSKGEKSSPRASDLSSISALSLQDSGSYATSGALSIPGSPAFSWPHALLSIRSFESPASAALPQLQSLG